MNKPTLNYPFVEPDIAKLARDKGYNEVNVGIYLAPGEPVTVWERSLTDEPCINSSFSHAVATAPTYQELLDWLREDKGFDIYFEVVELDDGPSYKFFIKDKNGRAILLVTWHPNYYLCLQNAIGIALTRIKNQG